MSKVDELEEIRYPIGRLTIDHDVTDSKRRLWIAQIAEAPAKLCAAVDGLSDAQTPDSSHVYSLAGHQRFAGWLKAVVLGFLAARNSSCFSGRRRSLSGNIGLRPCYHGFLKG